MPPAFAPRGALRRLLRHLLFAGIGVTAAPAAASSDDGREGDAEADTDEVVLDVVDAALELAGDPPDPRAGGHALALVLEHMHPLDATRTAATAAMSPRASVRCALGEALTWRFPLVGAGLVVEHLARDEVPAVRVAAARAAFTRHFHAVLTTLSHDPDPTVQEVAILALGGG